jgi:hypothetical protein
VEQKEVGAINSPDYSGAYGEIQILNELKMLDDGYHIFCDLNIHLEDYITYRGNRNLKSAQMDFVVIGPTGIFVIEVKNWSNKYSTSHHGISPHEQIDRAGLVLWIFLKKQFFIFKPRTTKVLVPIQRNIKYNSYYKSVLIRDVPNLRRFIVNNGVNLSESRIKKLLFVLYNNHK